MRIMAAELVLVAALAAPSFLGEWTATGSTPGGDVSETLDARLAEALRADAPPARDAIFRVEMSRGLNGCDSGGEWSWPSSWPPSPLCSRP